MFAGRGVFWAYPHNPDVGMTWVIPKIELSRWKSAKADKQRVLSVKYRDNNSSMSAAIFIVACKKYGESRDNYLYLSFSASCCDNGHAEQ